MVARLPLLVAFAVVSASELSAQREVLREEPVSGRYLPIVFELREVHERVPSAPVLAIHYQTAAPHSCVQPLVADFAQRRDTVRLARFRVRHHAICGAAMVPPSGGRVLPLRPGHHVLELSAGDGVDRWQLDVTDSSVTVAPLGRPAISRLVEGAERIGRARRNTVVVRCAGDELLCDDVWREVAELRGLRRVPATAEMVRAIAERRIEDGGERRAYTYDDTTVVERLLEVREMLARQLPVRGWAFDVAAWDGRQQSWAMERARRRRR